MSLYLIIFNVSKDIRVLEKGVSILIRGKRGRLKSLEHTNHSPLNIYFTLNNLF